MNRRILALALAGTLSLGLLSACGGDSAQGAATPTPPAAASTPAPTQTPEPEATPEISPDPEATPEAAPTPEATPAPAVTPEARPNPTPTPEVRPTPEPAPTATPAPEATPPAEEEGVVSGLWEQITQEIQLPALMEGDAEILAALYGIDSADLEEFVLQVPLMNVSATEFFIARVKEGSMDTVKAGAERRQQDLEAQWSTYLPEQLELVQNYKLCTNGNYLLFVVSYDAETVAGLFDSCTNGG